MKVKIAIVFLFFLSLQIKAQNLVGKVIDEVSGNPVPFASIGVIGTNLATVTNESGDFVIKVEAYPAKLRCSHISYLTAEITLNSANEKLIFKVKQASFSLNEVIVDPYAGQRILKKALTNADQHKQENTYANAFYRQLTTVNGSPSQIYELFYDLELNTQRVNGWLAKQTRFAELNDQLSFSLNNQSYLTFSYAGYLLPEKNGTFVNLKNLALYTIQIEKTIDQKDQQIAVVSCKYKGRKTKQYYVNSTYYIGTEDNKVYRIENTAFNLPMAFTNAKATMPPILKTIATFTPTTGAVSVLQSISTKLLINIISGPQRITSGINSLLTVYKIDDDLKTQSFIALNKKIKDKSVIESITYNADFWRDNPVVKQTSLEDSFIKMMESKAAFGTMTNP